MKPLFLALFLLSRSLFALEIVTGPLFDLYLANNRSQAPLLVFIHGGGWVGGDKSWYDFLGNFFSANGVNTAVVKYRLSPSVVHPAHVEDVVKALGEIKKRAPRYRISLNRVIVMGHSAGAHMVGLLGTSPSFLKADTPKISALVGMAGIYDLKQIIQKFPKYKENFIAAAFGPDESKYDSFSPTKRKISLKVPWLIIQSTADELVDNAESQLFVKHLKEDNADVSYWEKNFGAHFDMLLNLTKPTPQAEELLRFIKNKK